MTGNVSFLINVQKNRKLKPSIFTLRNDMNELGLTTAFYEGYDEDIRESDEATRSCTGFVSEADAN